jgi:hypothetical protein
MLFIAMANDIVPMFCGLTIIHPHHRFDLMTPLERPITLIKDSLHPLRCCFIAAAQGSFISHPVLRLKIEGDTRAICFCCLLLLLMDLTRLDRPNDGVAEGGIVAGDTAGCNERIPRVVGSVTHCRGAAERAGSTLVGAIRPGSA